MSSHGRPRAGAGLVLAVTLLVAAGLAPSGSARTTRQDAPSPADVLKARGLKQVGSTYVLPVEGEIQKKTSELKALHNHLLQAARHRSELERQAADGQAQVREMLARRVVLNQQMSALDQQIRALPPGNLQVLAQRNELVAERNQAAMAYNGLADGINLLRTSPAGDPAARDRLAAELSRRREAFIQAVLDLRQTVDAAQKSYAALAADDAVKTAIAAAGRSAKTKPRLGPSPQFASNIKLLERAEQSVMTDAVNLHKRGGVFWVDATFNGKVVRPMVFDTGAGLTTIPSDLAAEIGIKPGPTDPVVVCETADGTKVEARQVTIPTMRVGRFTVNGVAAAVMPPGKGNIAPLLGQSFHRHFTYKFTPESGSLVMSRVEGLEPARPQQPARTTRTTRSRSRSSRSRAAASRAADPASSPDGVE
ncbi:MAG: TIGR02281 family clan AA aspartic protease [Isosphaeraceae bacterium]